MKKILLLILIGFLAACESSALIQEEEVVLEPVVVAPEIEESAIEVEEITYVIRYHLTHESSLLEKTVTKRGVVVLDELVREGYQFDGWFLDPEHTLRQASVFQAVKNLDLYPKWIEIIKESHQLVFDQIRNHFRFDFETIHPLDYYVSPSSNKAKADTIYSGMYQAAGLFEPYLKGFSPMSVTVLHPNDYDWYVEIVSTLDLFQYNDPWFERTSKDGGGAVFESYSGGPHMFFLVPDKNQVDPFDIDWYVHETMHIFQLGILQGKRDQNLGCIYTEGGATLIGNVLGMINEQAAYSHFIRSRNSRISNLRNHYENENNLSQAMYRQLVFGQSDRCNIELPRFGYNLGALVAEKMVLDFGIEDFMDMHFYFDRYRIDQVFTMKFGVDYFAWLEAEAVPYVIELIT